jgi:methanethiol S-methyltransferase
MRRTAGILFGVGTHGLFAVTVYFLYWFLKGTAVLPSRRGSLWVDALLALQFTIPHSVLLLPSVRQRLTQIVPTAFYGCFFCVVTCVGLLTMLVAWQPHRTVAWSTSGLAANLVTAGFFASWIGLFYSLYLNGLGYQTGWTPWWHWLRRRPLPPRRFEPRSVYLWLRHPTYLCFLGLVWLTPVVTIDRAILIGVWTTYVFVGSCLKDRRLVFYLGASYRNYQAAVAGYPGMIFGPLARRPLRKIEMPENRPGQELRSDVPSRQAA